MFFEPLKRCRVCRKHFSFRHRILARSAYVIRKEVSGPCLHEYERRSSLSRLASQHWQANQSGATSRGFLLRDVLRRIWLISLHTFSMELKSGEYGGGKSNPAPAASLRTASLGDHAGHDCDARAWQLERCQLVRHPIKLRSCEPLALFLRVSEA